MTVNSINLLPRDVIGEIVGFLDTDALNKFSRVSKFWLKICQTFEDTVWKTKIGQLIPAASLPIANLRDWAKEHIAFSFNNAIKKMTQFLNIKNIHCLVEFPKNKGYSIEFWKSKDPLSREKKTIYCLENLPSESVPRIVSVDYSIALPKNQRVNVFERIIPKVQANRFKRPTFFNLFK